MSFDDLINQMDASVMSAFGIEAIWNERKVVPIVIDLDVVRVNDFGQAARNAVEISMDKSVPVTLGDTFRTADATYTVDQILSDDGHVIRFAVSKS